MKFANQNESVVGNDPSAASVDSVRDDQDRLEAEIAQAIDQARQGLVGTELSNPLLHFRLSQANHGIQVIDEKADPIYSLLVEKEARLYFGENPSDEEEFDPDRMPQPMSEALKEKIKEHHEDNILQTTHGGLDLQERLLQTERNARSNYEEKGASTLYLTLGVVRWNDSSGASHSSPLLLVPVELERKSAKSPFRLRYIGQDIEANLALRKRLSEEFGVELPGIPEGEKWKPTDYFRQIAEVLRERGGTNGIAAEVFPDFMAVENFSFGNHLLYKDLDPEAWPQSRSPVRHPVMRSLFDGGFVDSGATTDLEQRLDTQIDIRKNFTVLNTDSSQLRVLEEIRAGKSLKIEGPPGTGKSTTIVNAAAQAVAEGKRVLIVSEKRDALRVAQEWLEAAGLGALSLTIDGKTSRADVVHSLKETLSLGEPRTSDRAKYIEQFESAQTRLNAHSDTMREEVRESGFTGYDVLAHLAALRQVSPEPPEIDPARLVGWTRRDFEQAQRFAKELDQFSQAIGSPNAHLFYGCRLTEESELRLEKISDLLKESHSAAATLERELKNLCDKLSLSDLLSENETDRMLVALKGIDELYTGRGELLKGAQLHDQRWITESFEIQRALEEMRNLAHYFERIGQPVDFDSLAMADLAGVLETVERHELRTFKFAFNGAYKQALRDLSHVTPVPETIPDQKKLLELLIKLQDAQRALPNEAQRFRELLGESWDSDRKRLGELRFWQRTSQLVHALQEFVVAASDHSQRARLLELLRQPEEVYALSGELRRLVRSHREWKARREELFQVLDFSDQAQESRFFSVSLKEQEQVLGEMRYGLKRLPELVHYNQRCSLQNSEALAFVRERFEENSHGVGPLAEVLERAWFESLAHTFFAHHSLARSFERGEFRKTVELFAEAYSKLLQANAEEICSNHFHALPRYAEAGQSGLMYHEIEKKGGFLPVRKLLSEAGEAVQRVKPIFLMSPQTVARDLEPGQIDFDLVLFDEGSQIPPTSAFGSILRADQTVIVGDREQLSPTTFFERNTSSSFGTTEEEGTQIESILDLVESANIPSFQLKWHYRSSKPGLIEVSNREFYNDSLVVFPSAETGKAGDGLIYHHVAHGVYEPKERRTNEAEASVVANAVLHHAMCHPEESLGVIALNQPQADAITRELEKLCRKHPELDTYFERHTAEPFFVKNLESAQGIERDRIYISVGYARDKDGKLSLNFGPLNQRKGANRLNVLATRAKKYCEIFSSLEPDEPEFQRSNSRAISLLNELLARARDGASAQELGERSLYPDPLRDLVKSRLEQEGYTVRSGIGAFASGVELGVVDPVFPDRYILGIKLDGPHYSSVLSARDREKLMSEALRFRGWNLEQLYAVDCLNDLDGEIQRIKRRIESLGKSAAPDDKSTRLIRHVNRAKRAPKAGSLSVPYHQAEISVAGIREALQDGESARPTALLAEAYSDLVFQEGPIHTEEAEKRIRKALGYKRKHDGIADLLERACERAKSRGDLVERNGFLYSGTSSSVEIRDRSSLRGAARAFDRIAPEEVQAAVLAIVERSFGIREEEILPAVSKVFGYKGFPKGAKEIVSEQLRELLEAKAVHRQEGYLKRPSEHNTL